MKLEPVFLVSRRSRLVSARCAWLLIGVAFACGTVLGTAGTRVFGRSASTSAHSTFPRIEELRQLAVTAPISDLLDKQMEFLLMVARTYRRDEVLWHGVARLSHELLANDQIPDRRLIAHLLAQIIEDGEPDLAGSLLPHAAALRRIS
jgi:hypothetical protein